MKTSQLSRWSCLLVPPLLLAAACSVSEDAIAARLEVRGSVQLPLGAAAVTSITGTYGPGCAGRSDAGTDPWTLSVSDAAAAGDALTVRKNDSACVLSLTTLLADGELYHAAPSLTLAPGSIDDGGAPSAFAPDGGAPVFYGSAELHTLDFASDFSLSLLFSESPRSSEGTKAAIRAAPALLGTQSFAVLAGTTVTNTGSGTTIGGDLGVAPGTAITGIPSGQPSGATYLGSDPMAVDAQADLTTLYDDLVGRPCPPANVLSDEDLAGKTLAPGVYCFTATATLSSVAALTLDAQYDSRAYWVFQIGSTLSVAATSTVTMIHGGSACNVFWQVGSSATVLADAAFAGNILAYDSITLNAGASLVPGRALARMGAVTMSTNPISMGSCP